MKILYELFKIDVLCFVLISIYIVQVYGKSEFINKWKEYINFIKSMRR